MPRLTVKALIKLLKAENPDNFVVFQDHDHSDDEFNDFVRRVETMKDQNITVLRG